MRSYRTKATTAAAAAAANFYCNDYDFCVDFMHSLQPGARSIHTRGGLP